MSSASVYVARSKSGAVKVGFSSNPQRRMKWLPSGTALAYVTGDTMSVDAARRLERLAHRVLVLSGKRISGEWFAVTVADAVAAIEVALRQASMNELELGGHVARHDRPRPSMVAVNFSMPRAMRDGLDAILAERTDGQDRAGLVREIIAEALDARRGKGKR